MRKSIFDTEATTWVSGGPVLGLPALQGSDDERNLAAKIREAGLRRLFSAPSALDIRMQHEALQLAEELCTETSAAVIVSRAHDYLAAKD
ncbi:MAG: hypothetical protein M0015_05825 [Betaproteobacteria bacterium]|nr:hypothetical protein [Betaproteobacteria bacterium]